jgi:hypothetical protein
VEGGGRGDLSQRSQAYLLIHDPLEAGVYSDEAGGRREVEATGEVEGGREEGGEGKREGE